MFKLAVIPVLLWLTIIAGWIINTRKAIMAVVALAHIADASGELILRAVGIVFFPLGVIMGLFVW